MLFRRPANGIRAAALFLLKPFQAEELRAFAFGVCGPSCSLIRARQRVTHTGAVRLELRGGLELCNGSCDVVQVELDLPKDAASDKTPRREANGLCGPAQCGLELTPLERLLRELQHRARIVRRNPQFLGELLHGLAGTIAKQVHAVQIVDVRSIRV